MTNKKYLNPGCKLVDEVVGWLCGNDRFAGRVVRTAEGAASLAQVMVVVPTAQSGRNLRLALAQEAAKRGWGGLLPPKVVQPMQLVKCADESQRIATEIELRAAFLKLVGELSVSQRDDYPHLFHPQDMDFRAALAFFDQLIDIWRILAGGGITMADVPAHPKAVERLQAGLGDEQVRWEELAEFERVFFARLHDCGLRHQAEDIKLARTNPQPIPETIEEVVLPVLVDPVAALYEVLQHQRETLKITELGYDEAPEVGLRDEDIICLPTDEALAKRVAEDFPPAKAEVRRPSLGLCDAELFQELSAAFLNRGYELHNPERHRLVVSSLGRILSNLIDLYIARKDRLPWTPFVSLLREDDVLLAFADGGNRLGRRMVLAGIDVCQNRFMPTVLPKDLDYDTNAVHPRQRPEFEAFVASGKELLSALETAWSDAATPVAFLRRALDALFARRALLGTDGEMEFRAAIDALRAVLDAFDGESAVMAGLDEATTVGLLRKALSEASYSLEPAGRDAVNTEGWLELIWSAADKLALVGLTEGAVPDTVVGHPFVPDDLRVALGLTSNAARLARDTRILTNIIRARSLTPGAVRAYLSMTSASGDQRRPSRLLFRVEPEALAQRVRRLFGEMPAGECRSARQLEAKWRPALPLDEVALPNVSKQFPEGRLSASAIDAWLRCPFTYLLKYGLKMEHFREKLEMEASDFGLLIHGVLEDYANEQLKRTRDGLNQLTDVRDISAALSRLLKARREQYGERLALRIRLQFDAAEGRLLAFAPLQAKWASEGWQIAEAPEYQFNVRPFAGEGEVDMQFKGSIDRIDRKGDAYRLIDYKTWSAKSDAKKHFIVKGDLQHEHAVRLGLPEIEDRRLLSVQLLLYAHCLQCADAKFRDRIADCCYVILGKNAENVAVFGSSLDQGEFDVYRRACDRIHLLDYLNLALDTTRTAIRRIRGNFFWPPGPGEDWKYDFKELFMISPEKDLAIGTPWRDAQEAKLNGLEGVQ